MEEYYVYVYYLEDSIPFYVGMGKNNRMNIHTSKCFCDKKSHNFPFYRKLRKLINNNIYFNCTKIKTNLTQKEAWSIEKIIIKNLGRKYIGGGILYNLASGGKGGSGGLLAYKKVALYNSQTYKLEKTFKSIKDCIQFLNIKSAGNVTQAVNDKTKLRNYYLAYYTISPQSIFIPKAKRSYVKMSTQIISTNIITNEIKIFNSSRLCCEYYKIHKQTLRSKILNNLVFKNTYIFSYD